MTKYVLPTIILNFSPTLHAKRQIYLPIQYNWKKVKQGRWDMWDKVVDID